MEKQTSKLCMCQTEEKIVLSCSGASELGYISDQIARKLHRHKIRKMNCLTVVATCDDEKIKDFEKVNILVIDGCSEDCGKKIMAMRNINDYEYFRLTDHGYEKGKTSSSQDIINEIYNKVKTI